MEKSLDEIKNTQDSIEKRLVAIKNTEDSIEVSLN
jgi:hypothetical protein